MKIKYTGSADIRKIDKGGWPEGVDGPSVEWSADNDFVQDVPAEAANWLLENDPEFKKA